jgi:thiamine-phosphate pyrophosphorylase
LILYYITDRKQFSGNPGEQCRRMLAKVDEAARAGVDAIQLREKDLPTRDLERLAREALEIVVAARRKGSRTRFLINSHADVAIACGADGVHLTSTDISAGEMRALWMRSQPQRPPVICVSCHSAADVRMSESQGADFAVLAPIFGKKETGREGIGLAALAEACGRLRSPEHTESAPKPQRFPVLALGGVTLENARACLEAGAAGVAGIRLFQETDVAEVVNKLKPAINRMERSFEFGP